MDAIDVEGRKSQWRWSADEGLGSNVSRISLK